MTNKRDRCAGQADHFESPLKSDWRVGGYGRAPNEWMQKYNEPGDAVFDESSIRRWHWPPYVPNPYQEESTKGRKVTREKERKRERECVYACGRREENGELPRGEQLVNWIDRWIWSARRVHSNSTSDWEVLLYPLYVLRTYYNWPAAFSHRIKARRNGRRRLLFNIPW